MTTVENNSNKVRTIGQVVQLLSTEHPDVTHSSLRFLEREGLITPQRTEGGHRLFPPEQVERIRTIKKWQNQRLSLDEIRCRFASMEQLDDLDAISDQLLRHLIDGDRGAAQTLVIQADDSGVPLDRIFDRVLRPVLHETGNRWASGELTVGQEKEISAFVRDIIAHLGSRHHQEQIGNGPGIVAACVDGESHELGLRMISALLRSKGYSVYYLGPSVSTNFLIERVSARQPEAVLLCTIGAANLPALEDAIYALRTTVDSPGQFRIIVGGTGIPRDWEPENPDMTIVVAEEDVDHTVQQIDRLLQSVESVS